MTSPHLAGYKAHKRVKGADGLTREISTVTDDARFDEVSTSQVLTDEQVEAGEDYVSVMRENLDRLRAALDCV